MGSKEREGRFSSSRTSLIVKDACGICHVGGFSLTWIRRKHTPASDPFDQQYEPFSLCSLIEYPGHDLSYLSFVDY